MPTPTTTPRDVRRRLNEMEAWAERRTSLLGDRAVYIRSLFEVAVTAEHADFLAAELRDLAASHNPTPAP